MTVLGISLVWFKAASLTQECRSSMAFFTSQVSAHSLVGGFLLNTLLRRYQTLDTAEALVWSVGQSML